MYQYSIYYNLKITDDKKKILEYFFKDWVDGVCNDEITYSIVKSKNSHRLNWEETIRVDFVNEEDALAMKLRGIPEEFQKYLALENRLS